MNRTLRSLASGLLLCLPLALACGDKDDGGDPPQADPPDVTGTYQATIGGTTGCENDPSWINDWATGPLRITGTADALEFDFGEEMIFSGSIDTFGRYRFEGEVIFNAAVLDVVNEGSIALDPDYDGERWLLEGMFEVEVDDDEFDTNNCTITGPVQAVELVGA